jgi:hypothetical protein
VLTIAPVHIIATQGRHTQVARRYTDAVALMVWQVHTGGTQVHTSGTQVHTSGTQVHIIGT